MAHASSSAIVKSLLSRVVRPLSAGCPEPERRACKVSRKDEYVPTRYAIAERPGRFCNAIGVSADTPSQHPQSVNSVVLICVIGVNPRLKFLMTRAPESSGRY